MKSTRLLPFVAVLAVAACDASDPLTGPIETPAPVASVSVDPDTVTMTAGQTRSLQAKAFDAYGAPLQGRALAWSSGDTTVVVVSATGVVTARAEGVTTVQAEVEGKVGTAALRVQAAFVPVASVRIGPDGSYELAPGQSTQLIAKTYAADGSELPGREVTWRSSLSDVASVTTNGLVQAITDGEAYIIATSESRAAQVLVTVETPQQQPAVGSIVVRPSVIVTYAGVDAPVRATVRGPGGEILSGAAIVWTSSSPEVATVSQSGVVRGARGGEATITATVGGKSATVAAVINTTSTYHLVYDRQEPTFYWMDLRTGSADGGLSHAPTLSLDPSPSPTRSGFAYTYQAANAAPWVVTQSWSRTTYRFLAPGEQAAWSPDGTKIAFRRAEAGRTDIWVIGADGSTDAVRLTGDLPAGTVSARPAWSPNGDRIVFAATNARGGSDLWIMNADGTRKSMLANGGPLEYTEPTWRDDRIVFTRRDAEGTSDLVWMNVSGALIQQLTGFGGAQTPAWSPDGRWIAFVVREGRSGIGDIYVMRPDGTDVRPVTLRADGPNGGGLNPAWTLHW